MSAILDALRRARASAPASPSATSPPARGVPAGLRLKPYGFDRKTPGASRRSRGPDRPATRWGLLVGVVVAAALVYTVVRIALPMMISSESDLTLAQREAPADPASTPLPAPPAPAQSGPAPTPPAEPRVEPIAIAPVEPAPPVRRSPATTSRPAPRAAEAPAVMPAGEPAVAAAPPTSPANAAAPPPVAVTGPAVNHMDLARRYHRLGDFEQALVHYNAVLDADALNAAARNNLGLLYSERGLLAEAVDQFRRAILIDPAYLRPRLNLAAVLLGAGRPAEARAELRTALAREPKNADALVNLALVDKADRQPDVARERLLTAIGFEPAHAAAHYNLAVLYDEAGEGSRAVEHYNEFLRHAGPDYGARLTDVRRRIDALSPAVVR